LAREPARPDLLHLAAYAEGMDHYIEGKHREAVSRLGEWLEAGPPAEEQPFQTLALAALSRIAQGGDDDPGLATRAQELVERLSPLPRDPRPASEVS
jgi:hypothetical protein